MPAKTERYVIQCRDMRNGLDTIYVKDHLELIEWINRYVARFGPIDLLYRVL